MTPMCECCHVQLIEGGASKTPGLCSKCDEAWAAVQTLAPSYKLHVLASTLCHSRREITRRLECTATAHGSAIGNATRASGVPRELLFKAAAWGLRTGKLEKPKGFEDCTTNGEHPEPVKAHVSSYAPASAPQKIPTPARREEKPALPTVAEAVRELGIVGPAPEPPSETPAAVAPELVVERIGEAEELAAFDEALAKLVQAAPAIPRAYLSIPLDELADRQILAAMEAERTRRLFETASARLAQMMLQGDYLDDVPAFLRVAYSYGVARGESRALEALAKAS